MILFDHYDLSPYLTLSSSNIATNLSRSSTTSSSSSRICFSSAACVGVFSESDKVLVTMGVNQNMPRVYHSNKISLKTNKQHYYKRVKRKTQKKHHAHTSHIILIYLILISLNFKLELDIRNIYLPISKFKTMKIGEI